jgi:hypothetical protein
MKVKNSEDLEDIIKVLIDLLEEKNISLDKITLRLRENHYCINCKQHFNRCKCDESESPDSSDSESESNSSYISESESIDLSNSESPSDSDDSS